MKLQTVVPLAYTVHSTQYFDEPSSYIFSDDLADIRKNRGAYKDAALAMTRAMSGPEVRSRGRLWGPGS